MTKIVFRKDMQPSYQRKKTTVMKFFGSEDEGSQL